MLFEVAKICPDKYFLVSECLIKKKIQQFVEKFGSMDFIV